jgi:hypothetical protein
LLGVRLLICEYLWSTLSGRGFIHD